MAYYKPCKNCAIDKAACARRSEIASAVSGLYVTVVNFRCAYRKPLYRTGQRVEFNWTSWENDGEGGEGDGLGLTYHGTVIEECGLRFIVRVDDAPSADAAKITARDTFKAENLVIKVKPSDMRAIGEPDKALCPACSAYEGEKARCQGWGGDDFGSYWPNGCLQRPAPAVGRRPTEELPF